MNTVSINGRDFGYLNPYIIMEIGVNHEGSLDRAKKLIDAAARGGAHAAKFQTYKAELLAAKNTSPAYWDTTKETTQSQYELFTRWDSFGPEEYKHLADHCESVGIDFLSTPFDFEAVAMLNPLQPATKIASADITNVPLIRLAAAAQKPMIISTGAATFDEIEFALNLALNSGAKTVTLLHCILNYPNPFENAQLSQISELARRFGDRASIGYSDHVAPESDGTVPALVMSTMLGSVMLEKHFTDNKSGIGNDHYHSLDEKDLKQFTNFLAYARAAFGGGERDLSSQHMAIQNARRRVCANQDIMPGAVIEEAMLIPLRSNSGIEISLWDDVVHKTAVNVIEAGMPINASDIK